MSDMLTMGPMVWTRQPQYPVRPIPYFLGIRPALVWLPSSPVDLSGGGIATNTGNLGNTVQTWGTALSIAGSTTNGLIWSGRSTSATTRFTAASVFIWQSGAANNFPQLLGQSTANNGYRIGAATTGTPGTTVAIGLTKGAIASLATVTITENVPYFVVTSHREDSGEYYILLRNLITNEVSRASATNTSTSIASNGSYVVGNARRDFSGSWNGTIGLAYMSLDFLPEASAIRWLANPWQLFQPLPRRIFVASTGTAPNQGSGTASATGSATGTGYVLNYGSGTASATGTATGTGYNLHYGSGAATGVGSAQGEGLAPSTTAQGSGTAAATGSAVGEGYRLSYGYGTVTGVGSAVGAGEVSNLRGRSRRGRRPIWVIEGSKKKCLRRRCERSGNISPRLRPLSMSFRSSERSGRLWN